MLQQDVHASYKLTKITDPPTNAAIMYYDYVSSCELSLMPVVYHLWVLGGASAATRVVGGGALRYQ